MNKNFEQSLERWAEKTADICHEIAVHDDDSIKMDRLFYAFQSEPMFAPNLLIVGLNPGGDYPYLGSCKDRWINRITANEIKHKNTYFDSNKCVIWKKLQLSFTSDKMKSILQHSVYMNQVYFNTPNYAVLQNSEAGRNATKVCRQLTQELIFDIIKPKNVLCLGVSECFIEKGLGTEYEVLKVNPKNKKLLTRKECQGIPVFAIPHPSGARGITNVDRVIIGQLLESEL